MVTMITIWYDEVGDICAIQTTKKWQKCSLGFSVYYTWCIIHWCTTVRQFKQFFALNFLVYSPKLVGLIEELDELEFNTIYQSYLLVISTSTWRVLMELSYSISCNKPFNWILIHPFQQLEMLHASMLWFTRHIEHLLTRNCISYYSYYKPLSSITDVNE